MRNKNFQIIILLLFLIPFLISCDKNISSGDLFEKEGLTYFKDGNTDKLFSGKFEDKTASGIVITEGYYQAGLKSDYWVYYDTTRTVTRKILYYKGRILNEMKWYPDRKLFYEKYSNDSGITQEYKEYAHNGILNTIGTFKNNTKYGKWSVLDSYGNVISSYTIDSLTGKADSQESKVK